MDELSPDILRRISHREFEERFLGYDTREGVSEMDRTEIREKADVFLTQRKRRYWSDTDIARDQMTDFALSQLTAAQERIEKLEAALREYADADNWSHVDGWLQGWDKTLTGTDIAQTALREEAE